MEEKEKSKLKPTDKQARKVGEKLRRDRLNGLITQLAEEVPTIRNAQRRLDKSSILRLTVSYLKLHDGLKRKKVAVRNRIFQESGLYDKMREVTDGAVVVMTQSGTVLFVSPKIYNMLGHYQSEMIGYNLAQFVHPEDQDLFISQLPAKSGSSESSSYGKVVNNNGVQKISEVQVLEVEKSSFYVKMLRATRRRQNVGTVKNEYELMSVQAHCEMATSNGDNGMPCLDELWMVASINLFKKESINEIAVVISEFQRDNEWATAHSLDGKIISLDQRGSLFHGYLPSEVRGNTPYMFIIDEDLEHVLYSHQLIMKDSEIPATVFRMKNRSNIDLYVKSRSIIINDRWTKQPTCIVSCNEVLSQTDGKYLLKKQIDKMNKLKAIEDKTRTLSENDNTSDTSISDMSSDGSVEPMDYTNSDCASCQSSSQMSPQSSCDDNLKTFVSFSPSSYVDTDEILRTCENSNKLLWEVYDERARHIPDTYLSSECSATDNSSNGSFRSRKRSIDSMDCESITTQDSPASERSLYNHQSQSDTSTCRCPSEDNNDNPTFVKDAQFNRLYKESNSPNSFHNSSKDNNPLLEVQGSSKSTQKSLQGSQKSSHGTQQISHDTQKKSHDTHVLSHNKQGKNTAEESAINNRVSQPILKGLLDGPVGLRQDNSKVQSPIVDSSLPSPDTTDMKCKFTYQLEVKHAQLEQMYTSQRNMVGLLQSQMYDKNEVVMDTGQKQVHDILAKKLVETENQIETMGVLLKDLEKEIEVQRKLPAIH